jgi:hypothetical protein
MKVFETSGWNCQNFHIHYLSHRNRGSSVNIVSGYGMGNQGSIPSRGKRIFFCSLSVQTGSGAHPATCTVGTGGPFLGAETRPGCDADHSLLSSAKVENE